MTEGDVGSAAVWAEIGREVWGFSCGDGNGGGQKGLW